MSSARDLYVGIHFQDEATRSIKNVDNAVDRVEAKFAGLGRKLDETEGDLKSLGRTGIQASKKIEEGLDDAEKGGKDLEERIKKIESSFSGLKKFAAGIGGVIAGAFTVDKIKDFSISSIESAASAQALNSQFGQVFENLEQKATTSMTKIAQETGMLPNRVKGSFTQMAAFAKTTGMDTASALSLTERATRAAADSAAFYDRSIEEVTENLQSFLKGNYESDAALGISATETTRNAMANKLYGKSFKDLSEAQKQFTLLSMVEEGNKLSGALRQAASESDQYENQLGNVKQAWTDFKAALATPFLDQVTTGMQKLTVGIQNVDVDSLTTKIKSFVDTGIGIAVPTFKAIGEGIKWVKDNANWLIPALSGVVAGFAAFKAIKIGMGIFDFFKNFSLIGALTNPIGIAVVAVGALAAAGVYLYRNWDTVKEKVIVLWNALRENPILGLIAGPIGGLISAGIYLYQNFDVIKAKAGELWQKLLDNPMLAIVAGPIGGLIAAGIRLYQNWDTVKAKAGELWAKTQEVFGGIYNWGASKIQAVVGFFANLYNKFMQFKNAISSFKPPKWVSTIGGAIGKGISAVGNLVNGSHATGLANVPFDGYRAELHKGEAVLTAQQSSALRNAGILQNNADGTPKLQLDSAPSTVSHNTTNTTNSSPNINVNIVVQGGRTNEQTANNIKAALEEFFADLNDIIPAPREG